MDKKYSLVPAAMHGLINSPEIRENLVSLIPALTKVSDELVHDGGRHPTGIIKRSFIDAIKILNANVDLLRDWALGKEVVLYEHSKQYYEEVEFYKSLAKSPNRPPSLMDQAKSASKAALRFTRSGFRTVPQETLALRKSVCRECPEWDSKALKGSGRCKICGCSTWAKLRMATEKCPLDKWGPVTSPSPEQETTAN